MHRGATMLNLYAQRIRSTVQLGQKPTSRYLTSFSGVGDVERESALGLMLVRTVA